MNKDTLIIFIKNPILHQAKTRLAKTVGAEEALHIYKMLLAHTRLITEPLKLNKELHYSDFIDTNDYWNNYDKKLQAAGDLGQKITSAIEETFNHSQKVCIIGSDCAELSEDIIKQAYQSLDQSDLVIGPANDGGYYLLGTNQYYPELFEDITWSTESVYEQTVSKAKNLNLSIKTLPELIDVDTESDWNQVKHQFQFPESPSEQIEGRHYYFENGFLVFTELYHLSREYCCQNGCRYCGYQD